MRAIKNGHIETAKLLINSGADVNAKTPFKETAFTIAKRFGNQDLIDLIEAKLKEQR